ncbi:MAG: response regulator transcription factor [Anaerolineae bacterium]|nr:response regulator transcription factor [Anaerolineae bacterium]MCO5204569.1 response regulator transcription factor [Anaerolineae bacterium]
MSPIRILIADDHAVVRRGLILVLRQQADFEIVGEARNGEEAYSMVFDVVPDVALLDWKMPQMDGITAARNIRRDMALTKTLILSGAPLDDDLFDALGEINGFVHKDISPENLAHAIRVVASGKRYLGPLITQELIQRSLRPVEKASDRPQLSPRELEVLQLMATPATYREIADELMIGETTVRTHVKRIMIKLDQPNRTQTVIAGLRLNLIALD